MLSGFLNFSTKRKIPIYVTRDKGLILMKVTVTIRLSLARSCDETSTMLSIALCFFFFNSWATTVQSLIHPKLSLAAEHFFFSPIDKSQNVKLYWNVDVAKKEIFVTVEAKTTGWVGLSISSGQK